MIFQSEFNYLIGVLCALSSGIVNNIALVMQKSVVNKADKNVSLAKSLTKSPMWIGSILLQNGLSTVLFIIAQIYVGPAIIPGLQAIGLIILAIAASRILQEKLAITDYLGIILMVIAITMLGLSRISIDVPNYNILADDYISRLTIFTALQIILVLGLYVIKMKIPKATGIAMAISSGVLYTFVNIWISMLIKTFHVLGGTGSGIEILIFVIACVILTGTNLFAIAAMQKAFQFIDASKAIPYQQIPVQIIPIFVFFYLFAQSATSLAMIVLLIAAIALIITSTALLSKRQAQIEAIKIQPSELT
jgi:drug/metabolite transporter (DMT)-like permease